MEISRLGRCAIAALLVGSAAWAFPQWEPTLAPSRQVDSTPAFAPGTSIHALGPRALGAWLPDLPCCDSIYWAFFEADGGYAVQPGTPGVGVRYPPHVDVDPDAGVWLLLWPDNGSGGHTAATRISQLGLYLDGVGNQISTTSATTFVRSASLASGFRIFERSDLTLGVTSFDFSRIGVPTPPVAQPDMGQPLAFSVAGIGSTVAWGWVESGLFKLKVEVNGDAGVVPMVISANESAATEGSEQLMFLISGGPVMTALPLALNGTVMPMQSFASSGSVAPAIAFDGIGYWAVWAGTGNSGVQFGHLDSTGLLDSPIWPLINGTVTVTSPKIAPVSTTSGWLLFNELRVGSWYPFARFIDFTLPPNDGGIDAGFGDTGADSGIGDSGIGDSGIGDSGIGDSGISDGGIGDSGISDGGIGDSGIGDGGIGDSGIGDSGIGDGGGVVADGGDVSDGGSSDSGAEDAGAITADASVDDSGISTNDSGVSSDAGSSTDASIGDAGAADGGAQHSIEYTVGCGCESAPLGSVFFAIVLIIARRRSR